MSNRLVPLAIKKEFRALAPGWLACLAFLAASAAVNQDWSRTLRIAVDFLGPVALGAVSMGHEYSGGTLSLLLSQPRHRRNMLLVKLGVLAPMLLTLSAAGFLSGVRPQDGQAWVIVVPVLCGLFIAPWFTMLCRNTLAGLVFALAVPAIVTLAGEIAAGWKFGTELTVAANAIAFKGAVLLWGIVGISVVAAVCAWRLFMRLEAIDGSGQAFNLPWGRAGTTLPTTVPQIAKRRPLWLLFKKELRLQQLTFVVGGLYVLGWFGVLSARSAMPYSYVPLLFALTALSILTVSFLAGAVASAEERQLGTLGWHALLPMSAGRQWAVKVGVTVGVACVLGVALPILLLSMTGSQEIRRGVQFSSLGVAFAVILLSVMSLYVSSLCASSLQSLLWSVAAGCLLITFVNSWFLSGVIRLGVNPGFSPFESLSWWTIWRTQTSGRLLTLSIAMSAVAGVMYAGAIGLLLRFARLNHSSAERTPQRMSRQLLSLGSFLAIVMILWFGISSKFRVEAEAYSRDYIKRMYGFVTVGATDSANRPSTRYTLVIFPEDRRRYSGSMFFIVDPVRWAHGRFESNLVPGRYSVIAVEGDAQASELIARRNPEILARLKARAVSFTLAAGDAKTLNLTLSTY